MLTFINGTTGHSQELREITVPMYYAWRAQTGQLLELVYGNEDDLESAPRRRDHITTEMMERLGRYSSCLDENSLKNQFSNIVEKAASLAKVMAQSESRYTIQRSQATNGTYYDQHLDEDIMTVVLEEESGNGRVSLVATPGLAKWTYPLEGGRQVSKLLFKAQVCW